MKDGSGDSEYNELTCLKKGKKVGDIIYSKREASGI